MTPSNVNQSNVNNSFTWPSADQDQSTLGNFNHMPVEIAKKIAQHAQNPLLSNVSKSFNAINRDVAITPEMRKIIEMQPILLMDELVLENSDKFSARAIRALDVDVNSNTLTYALPKIKTSENAIHLRVYHPNSGQIDSFSIPKNDGEAKSIYKNQNDLMVQSDKWASHHLNLDKPINPSKIDFNGGSSCITRHSLPNDDGIFAGTLEYSSEIKLYSQTGHTIATIANARPIGNYHCTGLALSNTHLYVTYINYSPTKHFRQDSHADQMSSDQGLLQVFDLTGLDTSSTNLNQGADSSTLLKASIPLSKRPSQIITTENYTAVSFEYGSLMLIDLNSTDYDPLFKVIDKSNPMTTTTVQPNWATHRLNVPHLTPSQSHNCWIDVMKIQGDYLLTGLRDGQICIWNLKTKELIKQINRQTSKSLNPTNDPNFRLGWPTSLAMNGHYLAYAPYQTNRLEIWDIQQEKLLHTFPLEATPETVKFDKDYLAVSLSNGMVKFWKPDAVQPSNQVHIQALAQNIPPSSSNANDVPPAQQIVPAPQPQPAPAARQPQPSFIESLFSGIGTSFRILFLPVNWLGQGISILYRSIFGY